MINVARVSVRGQVAVPRAVREKLRIKEGDTIIFEERDGEIYIRKIRNFLDMEGTLPSLKLSTDEMRDRAMKEMAKEVL